MPADLIRGHSAFYSTSHQRLIVLINRSTGGPIHQSLGRRASVSVRSALSGEVIRADGLEDDSPVRAGGHHPLIHAFDRRSDHDPLATAERAGFTWCAH